MLKRITAITLCICLLTSAQVFEGAYEVAKLSTQLMRHFIIPTAHAAEEDFVIDESGTLISYNGSNTDIVIPSGVTSIAAGVFSGRDIVSVIIPEGVTAIAGTDYSSSYGAFASCESLASVSLPSTLTSIGDYAFYGCDQLSSIVIPDGVTDIGKYAFEYCEALSDVSLGSSVKSIGDSAFYYCSSLKEIILPEGLESIGSSAFSASGLESLSLPDTVTSIGNNAFANLNSSLTSLRWTAGIPVVPGDMFGGYSALQSVVIPEGVTTLSTSPYASNYGAFSNCDSLTFVSLPSTLTSIGDYASSISRTSPAGK